LQRRKLWSSDAALPLFLTAFVSVPDPRAENSRYDLVEILLIPFLVVSSSPVSASRLL
jgi:hypothetical protein